MSPMFGSQVCACNWIRDTNETNVSKDTNDITLKINAIFETEFAAKENSISQIITTNDTNS